MGEKNVALLVLPFDPPSGVDNLIIRVLSYIIKLVLHMKYLGFHHDFIIKENIFVEK